MKEKHETSQEPRWLTYAEMEDLGQPIVESYVNNNPVVKYQIGWCFWNETWSECFGPFDNEQDAEDACLEYAVTL